MDDSQAAFFEDLGSALDGVVDSARSALLGHAENHDGSVGAAFSVLRSQLDDAGAAAFEAVIRDACVVVLHTAMVAIDGGTSASNRGKLVDLVKMSDGTALVDGGYHDMLIEHLESTSRLP